MRPSLRRLFGAAAAASLALCLGAARAAETPTVLPGHIPHQILGATKLERASPGERVDLSLVVGIDQALLDRTLAQLYGPGAPADKKFLSAAEFARTFDLDAKRRKIMDFAQASGLTVDAAADQPGSLIVKAYGPAGAVESAFGVRLNHYRSPDGQVFRANDGEPSIPASLAPHLRAVMGLSDFRGAKRPHLARRRPGAVPAGATANSSPPPLTGETGPGGGMSPADIKSAYGLTGTLNGSGQTVAIYELDGYAPSDIALYEQNPSLFTAPSPNPTITCLSVDNDNACGQCGANQNQTCNAATLGDGGSNGDAGMTEVALDIDLMIALAPKAQILVYTALNRSPDSLDAFNRIATDDAAKVVSVSWGEDQESLGTAEMASESVIFQRMAAQGQSIFVSAGDSGAYDASGQTDSNNNLVSYAGALLVDDPAGQPYVTGVGGTSLSGALGGTLTETVWNEGCSSASNPGTNCAANGAGGGGVANYGGDFPIPSYQTGIATAYSSAYRNVPDVALNADPNTSPYSICVGGTCNNCTNAACTTLIGGTSAATPLWAALTALVDQQRASAGGSPLGFANPSLYALGTGTSYGTVFRDITAVAGFTNNNGFYSAGTGYDDASGWGSFHANAMISALGVLPTESTAPAASPEFTNVGVSSITVNWSGASELQGTVYTAQISTDGFTTVNASSVTANTFASFGAGGVGPALIPATTYYFQVKAASGSLASAYSNLGYTDTPAQPPSFPSLTQVWSTSMTMSWTANGNPAGTAFRVDYWQASGSTTSLITTSTTPALTGLGSGATYFITVGALNGLNQLAASGVTLTTVTIAQPTFTTVVPSTGGTATIHPPSGLISLQVPAAALAQPVAVTLTLPASFPAASSPAGSLTGTNLGIQVTANPAVEPLTNTLLSISYRPSDVAGLDPQKLVVARYDPSDNVWVPLVSSVDAANGTVTGLTSHWSLFRVMQSAPSQTPSSAKAFPNPWRVSQGPASMTFSLLPAGARLRIYTLAGRIVKDITADASGMASWDGTNGSGRPAASGFYFAYIQGAGTSATLKLALQR